MALNPTARGQALFAAIQANNPNFSKLSSSESSALQATLVAIFGNADLTYLIQNTVVLAGTFEAQAGALVLTEGSPTNQSGETTTAVPLSGTGTIS